MLPYYYSVSEYLKDTYGKKLYKLSLSGNMTCPNRDGKLGTTGCIFCSGHGSGDFAVKDIDKAKTLVSNKYSGSEYIAYFQSFTNTYADTGYLRELFMPVILRDDIRILSIATRPDCLGDDVLKLLDELNRLEMARHIKHPRAPLIRRSVGNVAADNATLRGKLTDGLPSITESVSGGSTYKECVGSDMQAVCLRRRRIRHTVEAHHTASIILGCLQPRL